MKAAVIGLGKIGLPIAVTIADAGIEVVGGDASQRVVDDVNNGREPFPGEPGLVEGIIRSLDSGLLSATTNNSEASSGADVIVVIVPMYVDFGNPFCKDSGDGAKPGQLGPWQSGT